MVDSNAIQSIGL